MRSEWPISTAKVGRWSRPSTNLRPTCVASSTRWSIPRRHYSRFGSRPISYNVLAALKGVLRGVHGEEKVERKVSNSYLSNEIQSMYGGTMVALPPTKWKKFQKMTTAQLANQLLQWGGDTDLSRYPKHPRGPEKPKGKLPNARAKHVATSKLLEQQRLSKKTQKRQTPAIPKPL